MRPEELAGGGFGGGARERTVEAGYLGGFDHVDGMMR